MMTVGILGAGAATAQHDGAAAIEAVNQQLSDYVAAGDAEGIAMLYTEDAIVMAPNADPIEGREAITADFNENFAAGMGALRLTTDEMEIFGDTAQEVGRYVVEAADGSHPAHRESIVTWNHTQHRSMLHC